MKQRFAKTATSFPMAMAYCHLARVFRPFKRRSGISFLAILVVPDAELSYYYNRAAELLLAGKSSYKTRQIGSPVLVETIKGGSAKFDRILADSEEHRPTVWVFECLKDVPPEFCVAADIYEVIGQPDIEVCRAAIYQMTGTLASDNDARFVLKQSWKRNAAAFRRGRSLERTLHLLRQPPAPAKSSSALHDEPPIDIEGLVGYGAAQDWGLQLIKDIADYRAGRLNWCDVDPGILLSGPTGCGKTRYAEALSKSTGMPLICGSPGQWQSAGHLGDYLREMRKAFDESRRKAPAILLIDEIEGFGSRSRPDRDNQDYQRQVINAALESLDGAVDRNGVVVIGTTNFPDRLDPAFLRPGRLDRHIQISLPDKDARITILEHYLGSKLSNKETDTVALMTEDWSGSQLKQLARDARRLARRANRSAMGTDVLASLPETYPMPADRLFATAMHECGHAIVGLSVGRQIEKIEIISHFSPNSFSLRVGGVHFITPMMQRRTIAYYLDEIAIGLGGIAAELEILGGYDDGSAGEPTSDLPRATHLATLMEAVLGMGDTLISETCMDEADLASLRLRNPNLWKRVDAVLVEQMQRAIHLIRLNRSTIIALAKIIVEKKNMSGQELQAFILERVIEPDEPATADTCADHGAARSI